MEKLFDEDDNKIELKALKAEKDKTSLICFSTSEFNCIYKNIAHRTGYTIHPDWSSRTTRGSASQVLLH
eukprot:859995-Ditylum_brightwellii.AAC.2